MNSATRPPEPVIILSSLPYGDGFRVNIAEQYQDIKSIRKSRTEMIGSLMEDIQITKTDVKFLKR